VVAGATSVCNQLLGHMIVESAGSSFQNDIDWRETMQSHRLIALSGGCRVMDPVTSYIVIRPLAPRMAGIMVRRDHETGAPFHSAANQAVQGIISPNREIGFNLTDSANEAQELFAANIGALIRGEVGDDFAIASGGFVLISTDNVGEDPLWQMYNVMRGRDYIHLGMLRALRYFLGRYNIIGHTVQAILNTMRFFLRDLQADQHILGYQVNFRTEGNSPEQIRLGHLTVGFKAEEPPVLKHITIESSRYREAIDSMVADLATQLNLASS
jgi:phage tail sheath protein FI